MRRLLATLRDERYVALLDRLVAAANAPALLLEADLRHQPSCPTWCAARGSHSHERVKELERLAYGRGAPRHPDPDEARALCGGG